MKFIGQRAQVEPAIEARNTISAGATGGTNGRVVRVDGTNAFVNAANTHTPDQLAAVCLKVGDVVYTPGQHITGLSGLTAGAVYYLGTDGQMTTTPPTPSATVTQLRLGVASSATTLIFYPGTPIRGE